MIKIEIWSDVVCPFCYIGKRRLEQALETFERKEQVEIVFRAFQLDPSAENNTGMDMHRLLSQKYGMSYDEARQMNYQVAAQAKELGLDYHMDTAIPANSFDALRLTYFAKAGGKMREMVERLMKAFWVDSLDIASHTVLAALAAETGLDEKEALEALANGSYRDEVEADKALGEKYGIQGVPFFIANGKYTVSGAQPTEVFLKLLNAP